MSSPLFSIWLTLLTPFHSFAATFLSWFRKWDLLTEMRPKCGPFHQFGPHANQVRNCRLLWKQWLAWGNVKESKIYLFHCMGYSLYNHTSHNYSQHISAASGKDYICTICTALSALWPGYNRYKVGARIGFQLEYVLKKQNQRLNRHKCMQCIRFDLLVPKHGIDFRDQFACRILST